MPKGLQGFQKGKLNPSNTIKGRKRLLKQNLGRKLSEEHKRKISEADKSCLNNSGRFKKGHIPWIKGKKGVIPWNKGTKGLVKPNSGNFKKGQFSGEKHPMWKGGIYPLVCRIRDCWEYSLWRKNVFKRDDYTCQICLIRGVEIHADHYPKLFSEIIKEYSIKNMGEAISCLKLWDVDNGRTLCRKCHLKFGLKK